MEPKVTILSWTRLVYRDAYRALRAMPQMALTVFLISIAHSLAVLVLFSYYSPLSGQVPGRHWMELAFNAGWLFLLMPFVISVHRFVLIEEVTLHYTIDAHSPRLMRFFGSWVVLSVVAAVPVMWLFAMTKTMRLPDSWIMAGAFIGIAGIAIMLCLRLIILFPAIAVDAPGANWSNAYRDTNGHGWGIFLVVFSALLVFVVLGALISIAIWLVSMILTVILAGVLPVRPATTALLTLTKIAIDNGLYVLSLALFAATASRLYQLLGAQVNQPPPLPHEAT